MKKPTYISFLGRYLRKSCTGGSWKYKLGLWLFLLNWPFGYGGMAICAALAATYKNNAWIVAGGVVYGLSWIMLGLGTVLLGAEAKSQLIGQYRLQLKAFRRLQRIRAEKHGE